MKAGRSGIVKGPGDFEKESLQTRREGCKLVEGEKVENKKREKKLNASASKDQKAMTNEIHNLKA